MSWQQSRGTDLDWQYHRVEQLHRNVSLNAKKTRLILEEFEAGVKDSVTELKYISEPQFRISAPQIEDKLLEALKVQKMIQQLVEQSMMFQTTDLRSQTEVNVHSRRSSYSAMPAGVYTPAHTPYTGISSIADRDPNLTTFDQTPEGMAPFPVNISNILNSAFSLKTPLSMNHHGNGAEVQNVENMQPFNDKIIPRCNLNSTGHDIYSPEYATPRLAHNGTIVTPFVSNEKIFDMNKNQPKENNFDMDKNQSNDAYIEIPDDIYIDSPITPGCNNVCKDLSQEFVTANNSELSDAFFTPKQETNQENTNKEVVIEIEQSDMHKNDQDEGFNGSKLMIANQGVQTSSTKRKRESTCNTPIKENETKDDYLLGSENVIATNVTPPYQTKDHLNDVNIIDSLASFHIEREPVDKNKVPKDNILKHSKFGIDSVEIPHTTGYENDIGQTASLEIPIDDIEKTRTESLKQVTNNVCYEFSNLTEDNTSFNSNDVLLNSAVSPAVSSNGSHPSSDNASKTGQHTSLTAMETVIDCENVIYDITQITPIVPPLEQYTKVYVTHFEAPNQVWIQLEDCGIENFQYELNCAVSNHGTSVSEEFINRDNIVVAPFGGTSDFYRAKVNRIIKTNEEPCVSVNFLDYGNSEVLKMSSLVMMSEPVMNASCKAIPCILDKIDGANIDGSNLDDIFYQLVNNTPFYAYIKSEYEESELPGLIPRYVILLSTVCIYEAAAACSESHIEESVNEADLDRSQGISSIDSTNYASYNGRENKLSLDGESGSQPKTGNNSEDCDFYEQKEYNIDQTIEVSEKIQKPTPNIFDNGNFVQQKSSCEMSNIDEYKGLSEVNVENNKLMTNDLPTEDENEYILQVIGRVEKSKENANIKGTELYLDSDKKPKQKINLEIKDVSKNVGVPETNAYSGKWSSLITDSTEYTLNAEGKVVNFNSNESCTQLYNNGKQKSCRKRQITGNQSVSQKSYETEIEEKLIDHNRKDNSRALVEKKFRRNSMEEHLSENLQKNDMRNKENKIFKLSLPLSEEKKCPIKNHSANSECSTLGSDSLVPVEVLPAVKLQKQSVTIGAEEQIQVLVSHVDSPNSFFLHLINSETASIERFNENMTEHYKNDIDHLKVASFPVGSFWAVRWKDNCWYRAQILASLPRKTKEELHVNVRFVDHGDSGVVSIKDVRVLAETFTFVPMLALPCSLAQVSPLNEWEENPWTRQSIEGFLSLIGNFSSVLKGNFVSYSLNAHYDVVLENECGVINEMMVEKGFAKSLKLQSIIGQQIFPGMIHKDNDNKRDNASAASAAPIIDDFGNQLKSSMKQTSNFSSVMETSLQISSGNYKEGPISLNLLKNSNTNIPILPSKVETPILSEKNGSIKKMIPANINDDKCERGFIRKLCNNYGFIEHFGFQNSLFFHYSEFYGDIDFLDIRDLVEFEICFDEFRCKPMAQKVVKVMSCQEQFVGFVNDEILKGQDDYQCITYMDGERLLYIPFDKDDIEGYVLLKPWDKVSFTIKFNQNIGKLTATNINLEGMTEHNDSATNSDSFMDCQSQDTRWDPRLEAYCNGYNYQTDECAETIFSGRQNTDLSRLCKFYRVDGKCPRGVTCRFEHKLLNKAHTVEKEPVFMDLIEEPNLPKEGSVVAMIVTYVESPNLFYCYLPHGVSDLRQGSGRDSGIGLPNSNEGLHELLRTMCNHYRHSLPTPNRSLPAVGELRAAPYANEDGDLEWWRVRILELSEDQHDNLYVKVIFLDYGEVKWVKESDIRPLDIQFLHMPAQALECWLYDIKPPNSGWSAAAKDCFINLTKDRMLVGLISHCDQSIQRLGVKLYDTTENEININDVMINHQGN